MKRISLILGLLIIVISFNLPVYANSNVLSEKDLNRVKDFLNEYDVNEEKQELLIQKYENGILWDSMLENTPVRSVEKELTKTIKTIDYYEDGSVKVTEIEKEPYSTSAVLSGEVNPSAVTGGKWESGTGYRNCYGCDIRVNHGIVDMSFKADFSVLQHGYSSISRVYRGDYFIAGGSVDNEILRINQAKESYYYPAEAEYTITFNSYLSLFSWKYSLWLKVGNKSYWDENQFWEK